MLLLLTIHHEVKVKMLVNEILLISLFQTHNDGIGQCQCWANFVWPNIISDIPHFILSRSNKYQVIGPYDLCDCS